MLKVTDTYVKVKLQNVEKINKAAAADLVNLYMYHSCLGRSRSNIGGWQANYDDLINTWWLQSLKESIKEMASEIINLNNPRAKFNFDTYFWVNINYKGDHNAPHIHTKAAEINEIPKEYNMVIDCAPMTPEVISGVYYVNVPPNSGNFYIREKRHLYLSNILNADFDNRIDVEAGDMLLFWPDVLHGVDTNLNENDPRISIAFNVMVMPENFDSAIKNGVEVLNTQ